MPDWRELARTSLGALGLDPEREEEIVAELADHLENLYEAWRQRGASAEEAAAQALDEVPDWAELRREIHHAERGENAMNYRAKSLWLPGLVTLTLSASLLRLFIWAGLQPHIIWMDEHAFLWFHLPWLLVLPTIGALGAYWSRRVGGGWRERLLAGLFPAAAVTILFVALLAVAPFVDRQVPLAVKLAAFASRLLYSAVIPGAALLLGTLPFLKDHSHEPSRLKV